jgi:chemotaxis protein CheC
MPLLNELELDLLTELFNIGVGRAAGSLSQIVHQPIKVSVPIVEMITRQEMINSIGAEQAIVAVSQEISGPFDMNSTLIFPVQNSLEIVKLMLDTELTDEMAAELQQEAFSEIGNIFLNACIGIIANTLGTTLDINLPIFENSTAEEILEAAHHNEKDFMLSIQLNLHLQESSIDGYLMFVLNEVSFGHLHRCLNELLQSVKGN